jgi:hypothetical protein
VVEHPCRRRFRADGALQELFSDFSLTEKHKRKILKTPPYLPYLPRTLDDGAVVMMVCPQPRRHAALEFGIAAASL